MNDKPQQAKRSPPPVATFGAEILSALIQGSVSEYKVPMPLGKAIKFRARVHSLRARMAQERHPQYPVVARTLVRILDNETGYPINLRARPRPDPDAMVTVLIAPNDSEFTEYLTRGGITTAPL